MYEKVVNYYEENLCLDNMFVRKYYLKWVIGMIVVIMLMTSTNYLIFLILENLWSTIIINLIIDVFIAATFLRLVFIPALIKIYRQKVKTKVKFDIIGILMKQDRLSEYRKVEIKEMETFLKKECKIKNLKSIDMIIEEIDKEIKSKYEKENFFEKHIKNTIITLLIALLPVYFTNNNEVQLFKMFLNSIIIVLGCIFILNLISEFTNIKLFIPVDKKENLLELKRILLDIKIRWNK